MSGVIKEEVFGELRPMPLQQQQLQNTTHGIGNHLKIQTTSPKLNEQNFLRQPRLMKLVIKGCGKFGTLLVQSKHQSRMIECYYMGLREFHGAKDRSNIYIFLSTVKNLLDAMNETYSLAQVYEIKTKICESK